MPRKIVPKTRKIKIIGGISAKTKRSAKLDNRFNPAIRLTPAKSKALTEAMVKEDIRTSSEGAGALALYKLCAMTSL